MGQRRLLVRAHPRAELPDVHFCASDYATTGRLPNGCIDNQLELNGVFRFRLPCELAQRLSHGVRRDPG